MTQDTPLNTIPLTEAQHGHDCGCPGAAMVLVAPHNPLPLLRQLNDREGDAIEVSYLQEGPDAWRLKLARVR